MCNKTYIKYHIIAKDWIACLEREEEEEKRRRGGGRRVGGEEDKEKERMEHDFVRLSNDKVIHEMMDGLSRIAYIALLNR